MPTRPADPAHVWQAARSGKSFGAASSAPAPDRRERKPSPFAGRGPID